MKQQEIGCEDCQDNGFIEYDDEYNGSGRLVVTGSKARCHCQVEDDNV